MVMKRNKQRWRLGTFAVASMLALNGCADASDESDSDLDEGTSLQQVGDAGTKNPVISGGLDAGTRSGPKWAQREDQGKGNGKDVVVIGDSWMTMYGGGLQSALETANGRDATYRKYGVAGTQVLTGAIPGQFDRAVREDRNIKTVIMTGGGNDVLLTGASASCRDPSCAQLKRIKDGLVALWEKMAKAGVQDIVYVGYSEGAGSTPASVTNATKNGVGAACEAMTTANCHVLDSTKIVNGRTPDDIHPSGAAHKDLADAVMKLMAERKIRR